MPKFCVCLLRVTMSFLVAKNWSGVNFTCTRRRAQNRRRLSFLLEDTCSLMKWSNWRNDIPVLLQESTVVLCEYQSSVCNKSALTCLCFLSLDLWSSFIPSVMSITFVNQAGSDASFYPFALEMVHYKGLWFWSLERTAYLSCSSRTPKGRTCMFASSPQINSTINNTEMFFHFSPSDESLSRAFLL